MRDSKSREAVSAKAMLLARPRTDDQREVSYLNIVASQDQRPTHNPLRRLIGSDPRRSPDYLSRSDLTCRCVADRQWRFRY